MRDLIAALHAKLGPPPANGLAAHNGTRAPVRIDNAASDSATVWVYDVIGDWGVSAAELVPAIEQITAPSIEVRVNSPGGDYFAGVAIANALVRHPAAVTVHVDALAASAASVIAMAGDDIVMYPGAQMMIHDALTMTIGNAAEHTKTAALLDSASNDIAAVYASRAAASGQQGELTSAAAFRALMQAETWLTAEQAVSSGLATRAGGNGGNESNTGGNEPKNEAPQWLTLLHEFRTAQTPSPELPTDEVASQPVEAPAPVALPITIAARLSSAFAGRKAP